MYILSKTKSEAGRVYELSILQNMLAYMSWGGRLMFTARRRMAQAMFENPSLILDRALTYRYEDSGTREVVTYLGGYMPLELTCAAYAPQHHIRRHLQRGGLGYHW